MTDEPDRTAIRHKNSLYYLPPPGDRLGTPCMLGTHGQEGTRHRLRTVQIPISFLGFLTHRHVSAHICSTVRVARHPSTDAACMTVETVERGERGGEEGDRGRERGGERVGEGGDGMGWDGIGGGER